jgi:hypothetical protein
MESSFSVSRLAQAGQGRGALGLVTRTSPVWPQAWHLIS